MMPRSLIYITILVLLFILVINRFIIDNGNKVSKNNHTGSNGTFFFNNNLEDCSEGSTNSQKFWNYLSKAPTNHIAGEGYYFMSETYLALARLVSSAHIDLYDRPQYSKAHPVFPISQILTKSKDADNYMKFETNVNKLGDVSLLELDLDSDTEISFDIKEAGLVIVDDYYFANTELIIEYAKWARNKARDILIGHLKRTKVPDAKSYRSWLILAKISEDDDINLNDLFLHKMFMSSLSDSIRTDTAPIGLIFDALPVMFNLGWITPEQVDKDLDLSDLGHAKPLLIMLSGNQDKVEEMIKTSGPELEIYKDYWLASRYTDLLSQYYHRNGDYEKAMIEITRFWYDDMSNHPMEWMCFDNYPGFLVRSFMYGRWDGARLPLFLHDYSKVMGSDPILEMGFKFFQRYINEISKTF